MSAQTDEFPVWALQPKRETGVTNFINKYPEYDGRGVIIGVFDSGIDPGAPGLQVTTEGKPKIIGRYDCSGAGDVDTSTVVQATNGEITGLTGKKLKIPSSWNNPGGYFHIGVKNGYELYPKPLRERISKDRKEKKWDPGFKTALAEATSKLNAYKETEPKQPTLEQNLNKENLESTVEVLNYIEKKHLDAGPLYDCVVFHDGNSWCCCLDTSLCGDLASCTLLPEYEKSLKYACLTDDDFINYSVNIYNDGNLLEIVSTCSAHGTHVASIAAACFPDDPVKNGIAPGAQIVSLTIGDSRIDTMETGTAIVRAMIKVMESRKTDKPIDVINMSYGEHSNWSSSGRIGELMNEVVDKYGVTWVTAAGNHGPALCTIGTPPDFSTNNLIGVGAYVSPEMMVAEYSLRQKAPGLPYTWSSRGPTIDGGRGVSVCAPGGAITSVPQYTLRWAQLLNGTSMASPHVAGAIALLMSGMKANKLPFSPHSIRRALENTAMYQTSVDHFGQGHGLLQVDKAFENLKTYHGGKETKMRFHIACGPGKYKGIHLRSGPQNKPRDVSVLIEPVFGENEETTLKEKIDFEMTVTLCCDQTWVAHPAYVHLTNIARSIQLRIDPTSLSPGVHPASVDAYDVACPEKGPVFRINITVVKPILPLEQSPTGQLSYSNVNIKPGQIIRQFVLVPDHATYAIGKIQVHDESKQSNFIVHCMQLRPKKSCKALEFNKMMYIGPTSENQFCFKVKGGHILEFVIAKFWSEQNDSVISHCLSFHGCKPDAESYTMHHGNGIMTIEILGGIRNEEISPSVSLKQNVLVLKPSENKIAPLSTRDIIPTSRHIYELVLTYNFHLNKTTDITPNCSLLSDLLYESEFESQFWILYDSNKHPVAYGDAYPTKYTTKLEKGDYVLKQQIRHEKRELLERLTDLNMLVMQKLPSPITLDVYSSYSQALVNGKKLSLIGVSSGDEIVPIYVTPLHNEKVLKSLSGGQFLQGTVSFAKNDIGKKVDLYKFRYILPEGCKKSSNSTKKPEKTKWEEYNDAIRDLKTSWLAKIDTVPEAEKLYDSLKQDFPDHIGSHVSMLQSLEPEGKKSYPGSEMSPESMETAKKLIKIADVIISAVNQNELLAHFGLKNDNRSDATTIKTQMEKQKAALIEALSRKGVSMCRLHTASKAEGDGSEWTLDKINELWSNLLRFIDQTDAKVLHFAVWHAAVNSHHGRLLRYALKLSDEKSSKDLDACIVWSMQKLGWDFSAQQVERNSLINFPNQYKIF